ncbi:efflux RND transporter permease subunit [Vibrio sonorensis]|uniref:efflux RND transporter permease subunit n=1 Tax=Vibrio sonorensis TaxID=1004316 RepID=UPI0008DAE5E5|nr:efflux RND transporter permease subunit [Vibrio sonorensis]
MSWLSRWFIDNPVAANLLMAAILVAGFLKLGQLRVESFPQIAPSSLTITVSYPGGTANQIDSSITQRIEEAISGLSGIKRVTSTSSDSMSIVTVRKTTSADLDRLIEDVRNRVNGIVGFPARAEKPIVARESFTNLASFVVISGDRNDNELQPVARQVELALKRHPLISKVSNWGSRAPIITVTPDIEQLRSLGMDLETLAQKIEQMSLEARTGELKNQNGRITLRGDGYADDLTKLSNLEVVAGPKGKITVSDLAKITRSYEASGAIVRNNGKTAIALMVSTSQKDNLLRVSEAIEEVLQEQRRLLPDDIALDTIADMAPYIKEQLGRLGENAWQGLLIVIVLLGLFLELRLAFWVAVGIPVSLCGSLVSMYLFNYSINDITLFGFILVLGILVDDAVVVGESIYDQKQKISPPQEAAWKGVHRVSVATIFGVFTTIAAFSPMLWINNDFAKLLAGFSAVVIFALVFSLIESKFILPAHLAAIKPKAKKEGFISRVQGKAQNSLQRFTYQFYGPLLEKAIKYRSASFITFAAFVVLGYGLWSTSAVRSSIFPEVPGRYITARVALEDGAPIPLQAKALAQIEANAVSLSEKLSQDYQLDDPLLTNLLGWSDGYGSIEVTAEISNEALNQLPANLLLSEWREHTGLIEGQYSVQFTASEEPAGGTLISVSGADRELAVLAADYIGDHLTSLPGVSDVYHDGKGGQPQIRLTLNEHGRQLGLTQYQVAMIAGQAFGQREVHRLLQNGQETKIVLRYADSDRQTLDQLKQTPILLKSGKTVPLEDVAYLTMEQQPEVLYRRNREQVVNIYWRQNRDIQGPEQTLTQLLPTIEKAESIYVGVKTQAGGEYEELLEVQSGFKSALILTVLLIYILLAIPLKSYWQPLIIMAVIPFGFAGAIFGHGFMDLPISILSLFGMMAMAGIVVNDSLVLITRFNEYYRSGMERKKAVIKAATSRLRAIFLTTITTVCGLLPLLLETSEQAQYLKPAAVSLVFGELFATSITLILIPLLLHLTSKEQQKTEGTTYTKAVSTG